MDIASQLRRPRSDTFGIADLVLLAQRGRIRVPRFQRPFVWDEEDVRRLFDSIWRGFPIGTLLLWSNAADAEQVTFGPVSIAAPARDDALWVVDGQQRLTTLVATLAPADGGSDPRFEVCFDLRRMRFVHAGRRPLPAWWLPLRVTLESRTLLAWLRQYGEHLGPDELELADELAGALRDYKVPAYVVEHDDEQLLRDVFDRVNSAGKPISRAQVFHALFGGKEDTASARAVVTELNRQGFGEFDEQRVVQSLLAIRGGNVARDLHDEFGPNEDQAAWFDDTERALERVIGFLRRAGVPHLQLVPSTFPIPVLAAFFHLHPEPDPWNERLLTRWLWRGWAHGYGRSGQTPALRQAIRVVHPAKGDPALAPSEYDAVKGLLATVPDEGPPSIEVSDLRTNSAPGRLTLLALANLGPRNLGMELIDLPAELEENGLDILSELVRGQRSNLAARGFWPRSAGYMTGLENRVVLESHAVTPEAANALQEGDVDSFVRLRSITLATLFASYLDSRLESASNSRPPLTELFVPDEDGFAG